MVKIQTVHKITIELQVYTKTAKTETKFQIAQSLRFAKRLSR